MKLRFYSRAQSKEIAIEAWRSLAKKALVKNPFYEHWNLLPALEHLEPSSSIELVTAWRGEVLVGLFPLCYSHQFKFFTIASVWKHDECYCSSPLVLDERVWAEALPLLLQEKSINMLVNTTQTLSLLAPKKSLHITACSYARPVLDSTKSYESMSADWPKKRRKEYQRLLRKASEKKTPQHHTVYSQSDCSQAFDLYKTIEAKGWKGNAGSAISLHPEVDAYYQAVIHQGCKHQHVSLQVLEIAAQPSAVSMRLITSNHAFEVKTSYCEDHRELSPGVLLETFNMQQLAEGEIDRADSCTQAGNRVMETLWRDRVSIYNSVYFSECMLSKAAWMATKIYKRLNKKDDNSSPASTHTTMLPPDTQHVRRQNV